MGLLDGGDWGGTLTGNRPRSEQRPTGVQAPSPAPLGFFQQVGGQLSPPPSPWQSPIGQALQTQGHVPGAALQQQLWQQTFGVDQALLENQYDSLYAQMGLTDANFDAQRGMLQSDYAMRQADLAAGRGANQIDLNSIPRQLAYYDQLGGLQSQSYDNLLAQLGIRREGVQAQSDIDTRGVKSDATARGAFATIGTRRKIDDIGGELRRQLGLIGTQEREGGIQLATQRLSNAEQQAKLRDRQSTLQLTAQNYGVQAGQLELQLQQGLTRLGLDQAMSIGELMDALNSNNLQQQQLAGQVVDMAMQTGPIVNGQFQSPAPATQTQPQPRLGGGGTVVRSM